MNQSQSRYITCNGSLYQCSTEDWQRLLTTVRDGNQTTLDPDRITKNEMFVRVGEQPYDANQLTADTARAILNGMPFADVQTIASRQQHAGAATESGQQQQAKATH
jgi:hypothetical protein